MFQSQLMKARSPTIAYIILVIVILKLRTVQKGSNPHQCSQLQKWAQSIEHKHWSDMIVEQLVHCETGSSRCVLEAAQLSPALLIA